MAYFYRLVLASLLLASGVANAAYCTPTSYSATGMGSNCGGTTGYGSSPDGAANACASNYNASQAGVPVAQRLSVSNVARVGTSMAYTFDLYQGGKFVVNSSNLGVTAPAVACTQPPDFVAECKSIVDGLNYLKAPLVHYGAVGLTACYGGYSISGTGGAGGGGQSEMYGPFSCGSGTPSTCTTIPKPSTITVTCAEGQYPGTVNGVQVCSPPQNTVTGPSNTTATLPSSGASAPAIPNAPPGTTSTTEQTTCTNGSCTTTTGFKDATGASTGSMTKDQPITSFCQSNPQASGCKDVVGGTFSGNCGSPPVCTGDAIQCATASASFKAMCALTVAPEERDEIKAYNKAVSDQASYLSSHPNGDLTAGLANNSSVAISASSFDQTELLGPASGAANVSVLMPTGAVSLEMSRVNQLLLMLGFVLQGVTFVVCAVIVGRG